MWKLVVMCQLIAYILHIKNKASSELATFRTLCALCIGHDEEGAFSIVQTNWGVVMGDVIEFKPKPFKYGIQTKPTPEEIARYGHMIADNTWQWEYNVNIFFRYTHWCVRRTSKKQYIHKHFPMTKSEDLDDNNTEARSSTRHKTIQMRG